MAATAYECVRASGRDAAAYGARLAGLGLERLVWNDPLIQDDLTRAEGVRNLTRLIAGALSMTLECWSPEYAEFYHFLSTRGPAGNGLQPQLGSRARRASRTGPGP